MILIFRSNSGAYETCNYWGGGGGGGGREGCIGDVGFSVHGSYDKNYTHENVLYQTTHSTQITVGCKSVLTVTLLCPKSIAFDLCSHISVQGKWLVLSST